MVTNIHAREIPVPTEDAGALLDSLSSRCDLLWPHEKWPRMRLDRPLGVGAAGGHGPIGYVVEAYEPGHYVRFRFTSPRGFLGTHCFFVARTGPAAVQIRHEINMQLKGAALLTWPLAVRWLHDALLEDALDKAESYLTARPVSRPWSLWVRCLRYLGDKMMERKMGRKKK
ncbi:MAG TPA: SRPBCC family protein [Negativicutes bacterium]|nr:SRPBCC family protein [Negativicutes bacterium]